MVSTDDGTTPVTTGEGRYRDAKVTTHRRVITAPATAPIDFAKAVFDALEALPTPVLNAWYGLYTTSERRYYDALVGG